jgi:hypothetical protein
VVGEEDGEGKAASEAAGEGVEEQKGGEGAGEGGEEEGGKEAEAEEEEEEEAEPTEPSEEDMSGMTEAQKRLFKLKMKINQGRKLNRMAVKEEHQRLTQPKYEERLKKEERKEANERWRKDLQVRGMSASVKRCA